MAISRSSFDDKTLHLNIALIGELKVGKTALIHRLSKYDFVEESSVGEFVNVGRRFRVDEVSVAVQVKIHDTCGMEGGGNHPPSNFFRNKDGFILTWDVTDSGTYRSLSKWEKCIHDFYDEDNMPAIIVIATKSDLMNVSRHTATYDMCCEKYGERKIQCFKTSAYDGANVEESFEKLLYLIVTPMLRKQDVGMRSVNDIVDLTVNGEPPQKNSCC